MRSLTVIYVLYESSFDLAVERLHYVLNKGTVFE